MAQANNPNAGLNTTSENAMNNECYYDDNNREHDMLFATTKELHVNPKDVDAILVKELNQLSINDREKTMDEIHGVHATKIAEIERENHNLIDGLQQMQIEFDLLCASTESTNNRLSTAAYEEAIKIENNSYIYDTGFRLKFLRAQQYHPQRAAIRLLNFLSYTQELFGPELLTRPIRWDDLSTDAISIMDQGDMQILPARDPVGRRIIAMLGDVGYDYDPHARGQVSMYFWQCLAEDEVTQRLGAVFLFFLHKSSFQPPTQEDRRHLLRIRDSCPVRISACHLAMPDTAYSHALRALFLLCMGKENRTRIRTHAGSPTECQYILKTYGIPVDHLPVDIDDSCNNKDALLKNHRKWCTMRKAKDRSMMHDEQQRRNDNGVVGGYESFLIIECPHHEDVLFGKGQGIMRHPGNVAMRKLLEERLNRWERAQFRDKSGLTWEVVYQITNGGGRFLKEDPDHGWFVEVDKDVARLKVSIAFRDMIKRINKLRKRFEETEKQQQHDIEYQSHNNDDQQSRNELIMENSITSVQAVKSDTIEFLALSNSVPPKRRKIMNVEEEDCIGTLWGVN